MGAHNSSKSIKKLFGFSRQQLRYWRKVGLFSAAERTKAGYYTYTFQDLVALKTIHTLKKHGISTYQIRKSFEIIRNMFGGTINPFIKKRVMAYGKNIVFVHKGKIYDALSGQAYLFDLGEELRKVSEWAERIVPPGSHSDLTSGTFKKKEVSSDNK